MLLHQLPFAVLFSILSSLPISSPHIDSGISAFPFPEVSFSHCFPDSTMLLLLHLTFCPRCHNSTFSLRHCQLLLPSSFPNPPPHLPASAVSCILQGTSFLSHTHFLLFQCHQYLFLFCFSTSSPAGLLLSKYSNSGPALVFVTSSVHY